MFEGPLEWLNINKEWLFSGGGIVILAFVGRYIVLRLRTNRPVGVDQEKQEKRIEPAPAQASSTLEAKPVVRLTAQYRQTPSPQEILDDLGQVAPYARDALARSYVGLKVRWRGLLAHVSRWDEKDVYVILRCEKSRGTQICFHIDVTRHPEIKTLKEEAPIWVSGEISSVSTLGIELDNVSVEID